MGHAGVRWVMQRWSGVSHTGVGLDCPDKNFYCLNVHYFNLV